MRAGELDRRVAILARSTSTNDQGEVVEVFTVVDIIWAQVVDLRGQDFFAGRQVHNELTTKFRIRYRYDLTTLHRLRYPTSGGRDFNIVQISEIGRRDGLEILAAARVL